MRRFKPDSLALRFVLSGACLCVLFAGPGWAQERTNETFRDVADRMVKAINAADYEGITMDFNKEMLKALPVEKCKSFFSQEISGKYGKINKLEPPQFKSDAEAVFVARCERGELAFTLSLDDQGRVAGMLFRPIPVEKFRDVAGRMVKAINAADYEGLRKDFNKEMLAALPVEKCKTFFKKEISDKFGKINKLELPQFKSAAEAVFVARCERGALDFTLTLDAEGRVAGMLFRPSSDRPLPIEDFVKKINASQDHELFGQLTPEFQKAVPKNDFRAVMQQTRKQFGKLNQWTEQKPAGGAKVYRVQAEKGACIVKITLDEQGKIAGLEITPDMPNK